MPSQTLWRGNEVPEPLCPDASMVMQDTKTTLLRLRLRSVPPPNAPQSPRHAVTGEATLGELRGHLPGHDAGGAVEPAAELRDERQQRCVFSGTPREVASLVCHRGTSSNKFICRVLYFTNWCVIDHPIRIEQHPTWTSFVTAWGCYHPNTNNLGFFAGAIDIWMCSTISYRL